VAAGESATVTVTVPSRLLAHWDSGWQYEAGTFTLRVGTSAVELPFSAEVEVQGR
jgi:beta-glucosidase